MATTAVTPTQPHAVTKGAPPVLCAVGAPPASFRVQLASCVPKLFSRITFGVDAAAFAAERRSGDPLAVLMIDTANAASVLEFLTEDGEGSEKKRLLWIHLSYAGLDGYKLGSLASQLSDIPMTNGKGVYSSMLAEHVLLSCLYFNRRVPLLQRNRVSKTYDRFASPSLRGASMVIVGYGDIGRAVARVAAPCGIRVLGYRRRATLVAERDDLGTMVFGGPSDNASDDAPSPLATALASADFVVNVLPLTEATHNFFDARRFAATKAGSVFVNIGRGASVVEDDLCAALRSGHVRGAAIDVHAIEPLPASSPLWDVSDDSLLLTPHNADISQSMDESMFERFADCATTFAAVGTFDSNDLVDVARGY